MTRILENTRHGKGFYNSDTGIFYPGQVSETEALIYCWVKKFFGESEANDPSWNIHELAQYIDDNQGTLDNQGFLPEGTVACVCSNEEEAKELKDVYGEELIESEPETSELTEEELLIKILKNHGFDVTLEDEEDHMYNASKYTPAGEDWSFTFSGVKGFEDYAFDFDPDDEFDMLYRSGISGLPRPAELIEDQQWKKTTLDDIFQELNGHK